MILVRNPLHSQVHRVRETLDESRVEQRAVRCCTCSVCCYFAVGADNKEVIFSVHLYRCSRESADVVIGDCGEIAALGRAMLLAIVAPRRRIVL